MLWTIVRFARLTKASGLRSQWGLTSHVYPANLTVYPRVGVASPEAALAQNASFKERNLIKPSSSAKGEFENHSQMGKLSPMKGRDSL